MEDKTIVLITGEVGLVALGLGGLYFGQPSLAFTAAGAFAGLVAGHLNGARPAASP